MDKEQCYDKLSMIVEMLGAEAVLNELSLGLSSDELNFQLEAIISKYDLEEYL